MSGKYSFVVQTLDVMPDGGALRSITPNKDGIYEDVPLAVLGEDSRNGSVYDPKVAIQAMTDPTMRFAVNVKEGNQLGEYGHPYVVGNDLARIIHIDLTRSSHAIRATKFQNLESGKVLIRGDIKPCGPYGQYLHESFQDPTRNTAFSLRALTENKGPGGKYRYIRFMVTFDAVDGPGFALASKRYMEATESLSAADVIATEGIKDLIAVENITDQQLLDILQTNQVTVTNRIVGIYDPASHSFRNPADKTSRSTSAIHELLRSTM